MVLLLHALVVPCCQLSVSRDDFFLQKQLESAYLPKVQDVGDRKRRSKELSFGLTELTIKFIEELCYRIELELNLIGLDIGAWGSCHAAISFLIEIALVLHVLLQHLDETLSPRSQLVLEPVHVAVDLSLTVFRIKHFLDFGPSVAQVEHELASSTDNLIWAFSHDRNLLNRWNFRELFVELVFLFQSLDVFVLVIDIA